MNLESKTDIKKLDTTVQTGDRVRLGRKTYHAGLAWDVGEGQAERSGSREVYLQEKPNDNKRYFDRKVWVFPDGTIKERRTVTIRPSKNRP
jgi:hypothetical protein